MSLEAVVGVASAETIVEALLVGYTQLQTERNLRVREWPLIFASDLEFLRSSGTGVDRTRPRLGFPLLLVLSDVLSTRQPISGEIARDLGQYPRNMEFEAGYESGRSTESSTSEEARPSSRQPSRCSVFIYISGHSKPIWSQLCLICLHYSVVSVLC
jgi:hypothetical protein